MRGLGESLPRRRAFAEAGPGAGEALRRAVSFQVSGLNADALRTVARMQFTWVDSISAHLDLNPTIPAVYLFRAPSFCKLQSTSNSLLSM